jgi:hypothetical protein
MTTPTLAFPVRPSEPTPGISSQRFDLPRTFPAPTERRFCRPRLTRRSLSRQDFLLPLHSLCTEGALKPHLWKRFSLPPKSPPASKSSLRGSTNRPASAPLFAIPIRCHISSWADTCASIGTMYWPGSNAKRLHIAEPLDWPSSNTRSSADAAPKGEAN